VASGEPPPALAGPPAAAARPSRALQAVAVCAAVFLLAAFSISRRCQLGYMGGLVDEHFVLGVKLRVNGTLGPAAGEPSTLRPPGYPAFVAAVVALLAPSPERAAAAEFRDAAQRAVYLAQAVTLGVAAALVFLWLAERLRVSWALTAALVFGLNPYSIVLVGLLHYAMLHLLLVVACAWALQRGLESRRAVPIVLAGVVLGLANLVRPVTIWVPALLLAAGIVRRWPRRRTLGQPALLAAGMLVALAPWAARNWAVSGRLVAVGDTGWTALWAQTDRHLVQDPARYEYYDVVPDAVPLFARATGAPGYDYLVLARNTAAVERVFRAEALANLRRRPAVYAGNALRALRSYLLELSPMFLEVFRAIQTGCPGGTPEIPAAWFQPGGLRFGGSALAKGFSAFVLLLTGGALVGLVVAVRSGDGFVLAPALLLAAMALTHALVILSPMHYYSKLPLVVALAAYAGDGLLGESRAARRPVQAALVATSLAFTAACLV